jgi:hypothetical protein
MDFADQLEAALKVRGFEPLIDRTEIYACEDWWRRIRSLIVKADTVIFVLSPEAVSSDTCRKEVAFAASLNKRFGPIVWRPVDVANVPKELSQLNFILFEDVVQFDSNADKLADALSTDIEWTRKHTEFGDLARRQRRRRDLFGESERDAGASAQATNCGANVRAGVARPAAADDQ